MPIDWKPLHEGDALDAASINDRFSEINAELNDLPETAVAARSLNREHLASPVKQVQRDIENVTETIVGELAHEYPGWPSNFFSTTAYDTVPISAGVGVGWKTNIPGTEATFSPQLDFSTTDGLLVLANIHVTRLELIENDGGLGASGHGYGFFMIVLKSGSQYYPAPRTIRWVDSETNTNNGVSSASEASGFLIPTPPGTTGPESSEVHALEGVYKDVPIRAYITKADLDGDGTIPNTFDSVHLVASVLNNSGTYSAATARMIDRNAHITAVDLHAKNTNRNATQVN